MEKAKKFDGDKLRMDLVPVEAIQAMARSFSYGAKKYGANNWKIGGGLEYSRLYAAAMRHLTSWYNGEDLDPESGLSHLDHCMACLAMLQSHSTYKDDRPF